MNGSGVVAIMYLAAQSHVLSVCKMQRQRQVQLKRPPSSSSYGWFTSCRFSLDSYIFITIVLFDSSPPLDLRYIFCSNNWRVKRLRDFPSEQVQDSKLRRESMEQYTVPCFAAPSSGALRRPLHWFLFDLEVRRVHERIDRVPNAE